MWNKHSQQVYEKASESLIMISSGGSNFGSFYVNYKLYQYVFIVYE